MFCSHCGNQLAEEARFCSRCGKGTGLSAESPVATAPQRTALQDTGEQQSNFQTVGDRATVGVQAAEPAASALAKTGDVLGDRYEIRKVIGQGGMGAVYEAFDRVLKESVALKVLLPSLVRDTHALERFVREARISRQLTHQNIVRVHDMSILGGSPCISMEHISGMSLRKLLDSRWKAEKPLSIKEVVKLGTSLCEAMEYAHQKTVHRDLKPDNILVTREGKIKVSDFGIATLVSVSESRLTSGMLGTAYYMAPEQMSGNAKIDLRADIYSLGVILYEAAIGKIPVGRFKTPREARSDVPEHIDRAIIDALSPDVEQRPETMAVLRQRLAGGQGVSPPAQQKPVPVAGPPKKKDPAAAAANAKRAAQLVARGKEETAAGRHASAFEAFDDATKADANLAEAWFERGRTMLASLNAPGKDPTQTVMNKFKERGYVKTEGALTIEAITTLLLKSYYEAALASFERATELEPENQIYKFNAAIQRGQIPNVLKTLGDTVKAGMQPQLLDKNSVAYLVSTGNALLGAGKFEEAKEHYEKAIAKDRKCAAAYYGKSAAINGIFGKMDANQMSNDIASGRTDLAKLQSMTAEMGVFAGKALSLEPSNAIYRNWAEQLRKINIHVPT